MIEETEEIKALVTRKIEYDRAEREVYTACAITGGMLAAVGLALLGVPAVSIAMITAAPYTFLTFFRSRRHLRMVRERSRAARFNT